MSYFFNMKTVYYNAFYAVQPDGQVLSDKDIKRFCQLIRDKVEEIVGSSVGSGCCTVYFDNADERDFFIRNQAEFSRMDDCIIYSGDPLEPEDLNSVNLCLQDEDAQRAFREAREEFRAYVDAKPNGVMTEEDRLLATIP